MPAGDEITRIGKKLSEYPHQLTTEEGLAILLYQAQVMQEWCDGLQKYVLSGGATVAPPPPPKWPPA